MFFFFRQTPTIPRDLDSRTTITIESQNFEIAADDLEVQCVLGRGAYGVVEKVKHKPTGTVLAVKVSWVIHRLRIRKSILESSLFTLQLFFFQRITATVNDIETKRLLMDLDISMRTSACPYTVHFYGAMFREGDVMICMEVMDISLDKFYARAFNNNKPIPENVLGKVAYSVSLIWKQVSEFSLQAFLFSRLRLLVPLIIYIVDYKWYTEMWSLQTF